MLSRERIGVSGLIESLLMLARETFAYSLLPTCQRQAINDTPIDPDL